MTATARVKAAMLPLLLAVAGCAAGSDAPMAGAASADAADVVCVRERPTGSHMYTRVCRTRAQVEAERRAAQEVMSRRNPVQTPDT